MLVLNNDLMEAEFPHLSENDRVDLPTPHHIIDVALEGCPCVKLNVVGKNPVERFSVIEVDTIP